MVRVASPFCRHYSCAVLSNWCCRLLGWEAPRSSISSYLMPLPELIEIVPFSPAQLQAFARDTKANIVIPGSKSITNRAIVLAALGEGIVVLKGALWSEDTEAMVNCMRRLSITVDVSSDPHVSANRIITVHGCGGKIPNGGTAAAPLELFVANAGTAARFLTAMVCLGSGVYRLSGVERMHERPQKELIRALRALGYRIETPNDMLPAVVHGGGPRPGPVMVSVDDSSQFASALLLSSRIGGWQVSTPAVANPEELPYVEMTRRMVDVFPHAGERAPRLVCWAVPIRLAFWLAFCQVLTVSLGPVQSYAKTQVAPSRSSRTRAAQAISMPSTRCTPISCRSTSCRASCRRQMAAAAGRLTPNSRARHQPPAASSQPMAP